MNLRSFAVILCFSLAIATLAGCAATLQTSPLSEGLAVTTLAKIEKGTAPLAVNGSGDIATAADESLQIFSLAGGPGRKIGEGVPSELSFSPSGDRLAASFIGKDQSTLRVFDLQGKVLAETGIPARVTCIAWRSNQELWATGIEIKRYSFGAQVIGSLFKWDTVNPPVASPLSDTTVRPHVAKFPEETLYRSLMFAISPYGDEIVYTTIKDPPMFTPYLGVRIKHIDSGAEREVAKISLGSGRPQYAPDGETLLVGDAGALSRRISLPAGKEMDAWPASGNHLAVSPAGAYLYLDGRLFRDGREVTWVSKESNAVFLRDGSGLVIANDGGLFLLSGLQEQKRPAPLNHTARILELRRLRILGLITETEFQSSKKKALAP